MKFLLAPAIASFAACAALSGCGTVTTPLAPPAAMRVEGVPTLSQAVASATERYTAVVGHVVVDWHPQGREMLVAHRPVGASTTQLFRLRSPLGTLEPLTDGADPVSSGSWEPGRARFIVFARGTGGDEAFQLYRLDPDTRGTTQLTPAGQRHALLDWVKSRSLILVASVPLDRTAAAGSRNAVTTTLSLIDPLDPQNPATRRVVAELPGGGWFGGEVSPDERQIVITRYLSATQSEVWIIDLADGRRRQVLPTVGETATLKAAHFAAGWAPDSSTGGALFVVSDRASEFRELMRLDLTTGALTRITGHIPWDVSDSSAGDRTHGRWLALTANVDGREELRVFDARTGAERSLAPAIRVPPGSVARVRMHPGTGELALVVSSARGPAQVHSVDLTSGRVEPWTRPITPSGLDLSDLPEPQVVRWKSFDGRTISGVLSLPPARFSGKRPVVMSMHGGPEGQSKLGWKGRMNYLLQELGVAVLEPNVRGSTGYGKTFLSLDDGAKREDSVKDMGSAIDWMATQPNLDATRVIVTGGSYGGYMALAASVRLADRISGAASTVGISNFVSFLENTESYRRDLRRAEYGDERDPAMRALLTSISPLNLADQITQPLLVAQGKNDPRVPWTESEQIVRKLQARGTPVWYLLADNEGHGFARRENADFYFATFIKFVESTLFR